MRPLVLLNPNTSKATTAAMLKLAREEAGPGMHVEGLTAPFGASLIADPSALAVAADAVLDLFVHIVRLHPAGVVIGAFGDPGLQQLSARLGCPVVGIAQAGMAEAAHGDRRFSVVTTTPDLAGSIMGLADRYGWGRQCLGVRLTQGDPRVLMADANALRSALLLACEEAVQIDGAQAVVIGGGPLAVIAREISHRVAVPLVEPVPAAVRLVLRLAAASPVDDNIAGAGGDVSLAQASGGSTLADGRDLREDRWSVEIPVSRGRPWRQYS